MLLEAEEAAAKRCVACALAFSRVNSGPVANKGRHEGSRHIQARAKRTLTSSNRTQEQNTSSICLGLSKLPRADALQTFTCTCTAVPESHALPCGSTAAYVRWMLGAAAPASCSSLAKQRISEAALSMNVSQIGVEWGESDNERVVGHSMRGCHDRGSRQSRSWLLLYSHGVIIGSVQVCLPLVQSICDAGALVRLLICDILDGRAHCRTAMYCCDKNQHAAHPTAKLSSEGGGGERNSVFSVTRGAANSNWRASTRSSPTAESALKSLGAARVRSAARSSDGQMAPSSPTIQALHLWRSGARCFRQSIIRAQQSPQAACFTSSIPSPQEFLSAAVGFDTLPLH